MEKVYLTVTALNRYIKYKFDQDVHMQQVLLKGEISNFKRHSKGHFYFTIKDQNSQISAVMFSDYAKKVLFNPEEGTKVLVSGRVLVYEAGGSYQINVVSMEQDGIGSLFLAYEKLKKELEQKGYFDQKHKKPIPKYPKTIGVITSPTGAAIRDIINTVNRRYRLARIRLYPALVQGQDAKYDIVKQIELANRQKSVDVLIVGRGGGSIEDLWAFNEQIVADAIYNSDIPIISAVGHETDFTIADFVSDMRAPTPTAGAEIATPSIDSLLENISKINLQLTRLMLDYIETKKTRILHIDQTIEAKSPQNMITNLKKQNTFYMNQLGQNYIMRMKEKSYALNLLKMRLTKETPSKKIERLVEKVEQIRDSVNEKYSTILNEKKSKFKLELAKLEAYNPLAVMRKGFSIAKINNRVVKTINDVQINENIDVQLNDGILSCTVKEKKKV